MTAAAVSDPQQTERLKRRQTALKVAIFATGFSGVVAEYVMSTLASYLLGDAVLQWTLTISLMLFAMGLGSRASQYLRHNLLEVFLIAELVLSCLSAGAALTVYFLSAFFDPIGPWIYGISILLGFLIGLETPLATRINESFEELRVNISSVLEKDYYGALFGGLLFAFVALPYLGLTYTPIFLGAVNLIASFWLYRQYRQAIPRRWRFDLAYALVPLFLILLAWSAKPIILFGEQSKYRDKVVFEQQTRYQRIVITQWRDDHWLYLNGSQQFSSFDEHLYHEPLVHPVMNLAAQREQVLILGGGDGLAVREVLKYPTVEAITLVDLDPFVTKLGTEHPIFTDLNQNALASPKVTIVNRDAYQFLANDERRFDVIIIDLPDPKSVDLARLYSLQFYQMVKHKMNPGGSIITQASSPLFSPKAFLCILRTMKAAGLVALPMHNHVPTMGEWGFIVAAKDRFGSAEELRTWLLDQEGPAIDTRFHNQEALLSMLHFGKGLLEELDTVDINNELELPLYRYYRAARWDFY